MEYTQEQISKVKETVCKKMENIEDLKIEEIEEILFVEQIEEGQIKKENFYEAVTRMGLPYKKKGRVPFKEVEEVAEELCEFLKVSSNPRADIKDVLKMKTAKGVTKINSRIKKSKKIREKNKTPLIERNNKIHEEINELENNNVKTNSNLMWDIYIIKRGEKRLERFEEEGQDIELLKLQNSFIDEEQIDELKELRTEYYESE